MEKLQHTQTNLERRDDFRMTHPTTILVKDFKSGRSYKARMLNISKNGLYFETDSALTPGLEIHMVIKNSDEAPSPKVYDYYRGQIKWKKELEDAFFLYGYGVRLINVHDRQDLAGGSLEEIKDMRKNPRKSYSKPIFFATHDEVFEGWIKDISATGIQIEAENSFVVGQTLAMAIPLKTGSDARIRGRIVWRNETRFGVKFIGKAEK